MRRISFVKNWLGILMYSYVHSVSSPIFALLLPSLTNPKQILTPKIHSAFPIPPQTLQP